jgi:hypothetical protein
VGVLGCGVAVMEQVPRSSRGDMGRGAGVASDDGSGGCAAKGGGAVVGGGPRARGGGGTGELWGQ